MASLFKTIGKGILYIIALPFFLLMLAINAVFGIFLLLFTFIKSIIYFFTGRSLNDDLPEDRMARDIKEGKKPEDKPVKPKKKGKTKEEENKPVEQPVEENPIVEPYKVEEVKQPVISPIEEEVFKNNPPVEQPIIEPYKEEPKPVIEPYKNEPKPIVEPLREEPKPIIKEEPKPVIQADPIDEILNIEPDLKDRPIEQIDVNTPPVKKETPIGQYVPHTGGAGIIEQEIEEEEESGLTISFGDEDD